MSIPWRNVKRLLQSVYPVTRCDGNLYLIVTCKQIKCKDTFTLKKDTLLFKRFPGEENDFLLKMKSSVILPFQFEMKLYSNTFFLHEDLLYG